MDDLPCQDWTSTFSLFSKLESSELSSWLLFLLAGEEEAAGFDFIDEEASTGGEDFCLYWIAENGEDFPLCFLGGILKIFH